MTTTAEVRSAAELERQRLARQAESARATGVEQAARAETETEARARAAVLRTEGQARRAREQARQESEQRKAAVRKAQGAAEAQAQAAIGRAREARAREARKVVLPYTKPRDLGIGSYIANVDAARKQAHKTGRDATAAVTRVRDDYFRQVDQAEAKAMADISKQKAGIVKDIRQRLASYNADVTKQLANLNSGVDAWEADSTAAINKAQADYEAAIRAQLDRPGTEVFADLKGQGLIPTSAIYQDYDKTTGQLNYTIPDTRSGQDIFSSEQAAGNIPANASYKGYDSATGQLSYTVPKTPGTQTAPSTAPPAQQSTNVVAAAGGVALAGVGAITLAQTGGSIAAVPTPPTWAIGGAILLTALVIAIIEHERLKQLFGGQANDAVITDRSGSVAYTTAQIRIMPQEKGANIETLPLQRGEKAGGPDIEAVRVPPLPGFALTDERWEPQGIPALRHPPDILIRDPFDVPELRQKASDIMYAAAAVQTASRNFGRTAQKELSITRAESDRLFQQVNEYLRQNRVGRGKEILEQMAKRKGQVTISESLRLAYQDYLRKKAILDAARKSYVASLNPQPIKGRGSTNAKAAAIGVWLAQDIMQGAIQRALDRGESLESALQDAQSKVKEASIELGLTQQQINAASTTVIYQAALSDMTQEAIKTASQGKTEGLTDTELETKTFTAAKQAAQTVVQTAVETQTVTRVQARDMTQQLERAAEQVAQLTLKIKLPEVPKGEAAVAEKERYPDATVAWKMGDVYKVIPPPYRMLKPITSATPPKGMRKTTGTPQQTLTFIGGKTPFKNVSFDLGVTDGFIDVRTRKINFTGYGEETNVGTRLLETTRGVELKHNPPLLHQLVRGRRHGVSHQPRTRREPLARVAPPTPRRRLTSHGVYSDRTGTRLSRRPRRHWQRIY